MCLIKKYVTNILKSQWWQILFRHSRDSQKITTCLIYRAPYGFQRHLIWSSQEFPKMVQVVLGPSLQVGKMAATVVKWNLLKSYKNYRCLHLTNTQPLRPIACIPSRGSGFFICIGLPGISASSGCFSWDPTPNLLQLSIPLWTLRHLSGST